MLRLEEGSDEDWDVGVIALDVNFFSGIAHALAGELPGLAPKAIFFPSMQPLN